MSRSNPVAGECTCTRCAHCDCIRICDPARPGRQQEDQARLWFPKVAFGGLLIYLLSASLRADDCMSTRAAS